MSRASFLSRAYNVIKLKIKELWTRVLAPFRRKKLKNTQISIISNNCWGGDVYRYFGLPYNSPTVGLYFYAEDYLKFISDLKHYLTCPIRQITLEQSKHQKELIERNQQNKVLALVDDVEVVMLHYKTWKEAKEKWERRSLRVNYDHLLIKFSRQNCCTDEHIKKFVQLNLDNKIFFDNVPNDYPCAVYIKGQEEFAFLADDIKDYKKYVDIYRYVNDGLVVKKQLE